MFPDLNVLHNNLYNCLCLCRERKFTVSLKLASKPSLYHLQQFIQGRQLDLPQETLQLLDVVLRENPSKRYTSTIMLLNIIIHMCQLFKYMLLSMDFSYAVVGRSFFSPVLGDIGELGNGLMYWKGFYQSLRPTQMGLSLNIGTQYIHFLYLCLILYEFVKWLGLSDCCLSSKS